MLRFKMVFFLSPNKRISFRLMKKILQVQGETDDSIDEMVNKIIWVNVYYTFVCIYTSV